MSSCACPPVESDEDLAIRLLRHAHVSVHPGHFYDFPTEGHLVLSLITEPEVFRQGIARLLQFVELHCASECLALDPAQNLDCQRRKFGPILNDESTCSRHPRQFGARS